MWRSKYQHRDEIQKEEDSVSDTIYCEKNLIWRHMDKKSSFWV